ncbi:hypothetical protein NJA46_13300 (plasmid) [Enterobacter kobei]|nr:hypothetical protein [Enterobacter kobei]MCO7420869.1 hypothetical protein [Enterobacter kobei]
MSEALAVLPDDTFIVDETTRIDVFFMALMVVLFVAGVLLAWLLNPLFKR